MTQKTESLTQYIKTVAKYNNLENPKLEQTLKQKLKKEGNVSFRNKGNKLQYEFNLDQVINWKKQNCYLTKKIDEVINEMQNCNKSNIGNPTPPYIDNQFRNAPSLKPKTRMELFTTK